MSSIKLSPNASGTGALTIAAPNTNTDVTFNLGTALGNNGASALVSTDSAGNLGLGVTPSAWNSSYKSLDINTRGFGIAGASDAGTISINSFLDSGNSWRYKGTSAFRVARYDQFDGSHFWFTAPSGTAGNAISFTQAMTLSAAGGLSVGTTDDAGAGNIRIPVGRSYTTFNSDFGIGTPDSDQLQIFAGAGQGIRFGNRTSGTFTERARIDSSGNLLVGLTSPFGGFSSSLQIANGNTGQIVVRNTAATAGQFFRLGPDGSSNNFVIANHNGTGVFLADGATSWTGLSDERLKVNLQPIENATEKVSQLRAVTGRFKTDDEDVSRVFLIAQDLQAVLPQAVDVRDDEQGTLGIRYTDTIPLLVAAIKEQQMLIEDQRAIITELTTRIAALDVRVNSLEAK